MTDIDPVHELCVIVYCFFSSFTSKSLTASPASAPWTPLLTREAPEDAAISPTMQLVAAHIRGTSTGRRRIVLCEPIRQTTRIASVGNEEATVEAGGDEALYAGWLRYSTMSL